MKKILIYIFIIAILIFGYLFLLKNKRLEMPSPVTSSSTSTPPIVGVDSLVLVDGRQCYAYNHEGTPEEPYTVSEILDITIAGKNITGTKTGNQSGPDMTNGYTGTITGTWENNTISDVFSYVIEGSAGKEREIYRTNVTGLEKMRYPLVQSDNMLVPDTTEDFKIMNYSRVPCEGSN